MAARSESEHIAEEVSALGVRIAELETRLASVDQVIARLEGAALSTAQALQEISRHWDAVYEAMRRSEDPDLGELRSERESPRGGKRKR
jgi:uncharacterized coiled-coil protein SlyX